MNDPVFSTGTYRLKRKTINYKTGTHEVIHKFSCLISIQEIDLYQRARKDYATASIILKLRLFGLVSII